MQYLHILLHLVVPTMNDSYPAECEERSGFDLHFPNVFIFQKYAVYWLTLCHLDTN